TEPFSTCSKITYLREICSSREACYLSLKNLAAEEDKKVHKQPLIEKIEQLPHHTKAAKAVELITQFGDEKVIIFTEYRASQHYLQWYLHQHGIVSVTFRGGFKKVKKDLMRQLVNILVQDLIASNAKGTGYKLQ